MADLYETMSTLRAVRKLRPDPIPADVLERVLQAACWAPTGGNAQPWKVIVVQDPAKKQGLKDVYEPAWKKYAAGFMAMMKDLPAEELAKWERVTAAGDHLADNLHQVPAILMFCANPNMMAITDNKRESGVSIVGGGSVYPSVQNAMLACVAEGLGCTLTTLHCQHEAKILELLEIPEPWVTGAMVPIGYPVGKGHGPITRQPPKRMAYADTFGTRWTSPE